jgi:hypothetical protein
MAVIYRPRHQRQINGFDPYGPVNCTAYSAAIALDRATLGGCTATGKQVREASSEPIPSPGSPGLNLDQVETVARKWHVVLDARMGTFADALAALAAGRGVVLQGDYDQMGAYSAQPSFKGDHAMFLNNIGGTGTRILTYDPLHTEYRYIPTAVLKRYAEKHAAATGGKVRYAFTRVTPNIPKQIN